MSILGSCFHLLFSLEPHSTEFLCSLEEKYPSQRAGMYLEETKCLQISVVAGVLALIHRRDFSTADEKKDSFVSSHDSVPSLTKRLLLFPSLYLRGLDQAEVWAVITAIPFLLHSCPCRLTPSFSLVPEKAPNPLMYPENSLMLITLRKQAGVSKTKIR